MSSFLLKARPNAARCRSSGRCVAQGEGLDEERIELIDCESIDNMPPYVRFFRALGIPVAVVCDDDKPQAYEKIKAAAPDLLVRWQQHVDWEGVLATEGAVDAIVQALEECSAPRWRVVTSMRTRCAIACASLPATPSTSPPRVTYRLCSAATRRAHSGPG